MRVHRTNPRLGPALAVLAMLAWAGCPDDGPLYETRCADGADDDGDGRVDCEDTDCWGTPECPAALCGNGAAENGEDCDGADLRGQGCTDLGYDGGTLGCRTDCTLDVTQCTGDAVCGNDLIDASEDCDGAYLGGGTCADFGFTGGSLTCDASCLYDVTGCEGRELAVCDQYGDLSAPVSGSLTCASEVGVLQWDVYTLQVQAGDCVDILADNGAGAADLLALAEDADGVTSFGLAMDFSQLDDELGCDVLPWSGYGCPAAAVEAATSGTFTIYVGQWYEETGTQPGIDTCVLGYADYTLHVAVNGDATGVTQVAEDQPL